MQTVTLARGEVIVAVIKGAASKSSNPNEHMVETLLNSFGNHSGYLPVKVRVMTCSHYLGGYQLTHKSVWM